MKVQITFDIDDVVEPLLKHGTYTPAEQLHEALCQAVHEQDPRALAWLTMHVNDITPGE